MFGGRSFQLIRMADLLAMYVVLGAVDGKRKVVPSEILVCYFAGQIFTAACGEPLADLVFLFLTGTLFGAVLAAVSFLSKGQFGLGDVKLLAVTAMTAGYSLAFQILVLALLLSFIYSLYLLMVQKMSTRTEIPFVPFLAAGAAASFLLSVSLP